MTIRVAATQMRPVLGDVEANLDGAAGLVARAAREGARWIVLPEFFTTGVAFLAEIADAAQPAGGEAWDAMAAWARDHGCVVAGSMLLRDADGDVRNAQLVFGPDGLVARHDKDLPTMWENALYVGGTDDGRAVVEGHRVGLALCWELTRARTVRRLAGAVDVVLAGSGWWSIPTWRPRRVTRVWERRNGARARAAAAVFARHVGAPVVHAAHVGPLRCPTPWFPVGYRGRYEGGTGVWDATGRAVGLITDVGAPGVVTVDLPVPGPVPAAATPHGYWLTPPGPLPRVAWHYQRLHGRRWYARRRAAGRGIR